MSSLLGARTCPALAANTGPHQSGALPWAALRYLCTDAKSSASHIREAELFLRPLTSLLPS